MKKTILNLVGAQSLSKNEQKEINGGKLPPSPSCSNGTFPVSVNQCLCKNGGTYSNSSQSCSNNQPTGYVWENATGCCYNFMMEL